MTFLRRFGRILAASKPALFASIVLSCVVATAVLAGLLPFDPIAIDLPNALLPPGWPHVLGTDQLGRDLFTRIAFGARTSLSIAVGGVALSALTGTAIGLVAAIPAAGAYNILSGHVQRYALQLEAFAGEFITILSRQLEEQV